MRHAGLGVRLDISNLLRNVARVLQFGSDKVAQRLDDDEATRALHQGGQLIDLCEDLIGHAYTDLGGLRCAGTTQKALLFVLPCSTLNHCAPHPWGGVTLRIQASRAA